VAVVGGVVGQRSWVGHGPIVPGPRVRPAPASWLDPSQTRDVSTRPARSGSAAP
jgi:hypothetical protein